MPPQPDHYPKLLQWLPITLTGITHTQRMKFMITLLHAYIVYVYLWWTRMLLVCLGAFHNWSISCTSVSTVNQAEPANEHKWIHMEPPEQNVNSCEFLKYYVDSIYRSWVIGIPYYAKWVHRMSLLWRLMFTKLRSKLFFHFYHHLLCILHVVFTGLCDLITLLSMFRLTLFAMRLSDESDEFWH